MPDIYGRPTFNDWMQMASAIDQISERTHKEKIRKQTAEIAQSLYMGKQIDPKKYDSEAYWSGGVLAAQRKGLELQNEKGHLQKQLDLQKVNMMKLKKNSIVAGMLYQKGDYDGLKRLVVNSYNKYFNDGGKASLTKTGQPKIKFIDGHEIMGGDETPEDYLKFAKAMADPETYGKAFLLSKPDVMNYNTTALFNAERIKLKNGKNYRVARIIDPITRRERISVYDQQTMEEVKDPKLKRRVMFGMTDEQRKKVEKAELQVEKARADAITAKKKAEWAQVGMKPTQEVNAITTMQNTILKKYGSSLSPDNPYVISETQYQSLVKAAGTKNLEAIRDLQKYKELERRKEQLMGYTPGKKLEGKETEPYKGKPGEQGGINLKDGNWHKTPQGQYARWNKTKGKWEIALQKPPGVE